MSLSNYEIEALAVRSPEDRAEILAGMELGRGERRQLDRAIEAARAEKKKYGSKQATREDVVKILAMYLEGNVRPFDARLGKIEDYIKFLELPFYKRWWVRFVGFSQKFVVFLERFGIRLVSLKEDQDEAVAANDPVSHDGTRPDSDQGTPEKDGRVAGQDELRSGSVGDHRHQHRAGHGAIKVVSR